MKSKVLGAAAKERDLGVVMQWDLRWNKQHTKAVKTAKRVPGLNKRS
jgi:hypothetical protein